MRTVMVATNSEMYVNLFRFVYVHLTSIVSGLVNLAMDVRVTLAKS